MTEDAKFAAVLGGSTRGQPPEKAPLAPPSFTHPFAELEPELRHELLDQAREFAAVLTANSRPTREGEAVHHIPSEEIAGELAGDSEFAAAKFGLLAEGCELASRGGDGSFARPARAFALHHLSEPGFVGILVEHAATGAWSLLVADTPDR